MNDCIVERSAGRDGPPRPPVPGNSVESKQARQGASLCRWGAFLHFSSVSETTGMQRWSSQSPTHIAHHLHRNHRHAMFSVLRQNAFERAHSLQFDWTPQFEPWTLNGWSG